MSSGTSPSAKLVLGTRASPLALWQSEHVAAALCAAHGWDEAHIRLEKIITQGDKRLDTKLADIGGKGLFTEELEAGLRAGEIDLAVHSLKDLPTASPDGLVLGAILPRADARDVLVPRPGTQPQSLDDLPQKAKIGTASLRRAAQLKHMRPDIIIEPLRGNVGTRLKKLEAEGFDATLLAAAGLERLALQVDGALALSPETLVPAAGQGALAVQCRAADADMRRFLAALHCAETYDCVTAERTFLAHLDGSCRTPIAAYATVAGAQLTLQGRLLSDDGAKMVEGRETGARHAAAALGEALAARLRAAMQNEQDATSKDANSKDGA